MDFSSNENLLGNSFRKRSHEESLVLLPQIRYPKVRFWLPRWNFSPCSRDVFRPTPNLVAFHPYFPCSELWFSFSKTVFADLESSSHSGSECNPCRIFWIPRCLGAVGANISRNS